MWISSRRSPSGRAQKRFLNRARSCGLCGNALGGDRALYETSTGFYVPERDLLAAHPACVADQERRDAERSRALSERICAASERYAAEMRVRSRLIVVETALPSVRPVSLRHRLGSAS